MNQESSDLYSADAPIKAPERDQFRRWPFAQRIAHAIASRQDPSSIVISINGAWGEGKTTVLNFVEHELKSYNHVVCFRFNPWRFPDEEKLLTSFFVSLAASIGKSAPNLRERVGEWIEKYLTAPASLLGQGDAAKEIGKLLSSIDLEQLRDRIEELLRGEKKRVVVLMDDIDRLDKSEIQALFRLVKLTADFAYTAYVLAFDDDMVAAALQEQYSPKDTAAGRNFLEKIVQVPLKLPSIAPGSLRNFCFAGVDQALREAGIDLTDSDTQAFIRHFVDGLEIRLRTPRMAKRYGNVLTFALPIMKGEVRIVDFMLIEGIRVFYPQLYDTIRKRPEVFLGNPSESMRTNDPEKTRAAEIIDMGLEGLLEEEKAAARKLLIALFPRLNSVYGNNFYGHEWEKTWANEQRVCSQAYFPRYFSYSIPEGDVSDREIARFVEDLEAKNEETIGHKLKALVGDRNSDTLVTKLRRIAHQISPEASKVLATTLARHGDMFPDNQQVFSYAPFSQAAMLIGNLAENIADADERIAFAEHLLQVAEPLTFAREIFRWLKTDTDTNLRAFSKEQKIKLGSKVAERTLELINSGKSVFEQFPTHAIALLNICAMCGSHEKIDQYIRRLISNDPTNAFTILMSYLPTAIGVESGISSKGDFERDEYNALATLIDPPEIYDAVLKQYGKELESKDYPMRYDAPLEKRVAQQFAWIHRYVLNEQKAKTQAESTEKKEAMEN